MRFIIKEPYTQKFIL